MGALRIRTIIPLALAAALCTGPALAGCGGGDGDETGQQTLAATLMDSLSFRAGELVEGSLPRTTASDVALLAPGPTVSLVPSSLELMPLEVYDPNGRAVAATLIQFEDADGYVRVPLDQAGTATLIANEVTAADDLCAGLCNALFTLTTTEAVELEDGRVSATTTRQIVIDCREHGDAEACDADVDPTAEAEEVLCGDPTAGEPVWIADPVLNTHFEAVRLLRVARDSAEARVAAARQAIADAFEIDGASSSADVQAALAAAIEQRTASGLTGLLGDRGCGLRLEQITHVLGSCDVEADAPPALSCAGVCEPQDDAMVCEQAEVAGCRGLLDGASCDGACIGACQLELTEPAACAGTCIGTCDGDCPGGSEECAGPCSGLCTGECRVPSAGEECAGQCTGLCDASGPGAVPECQAQLAAHCSPEEGDALACPGDCFGTVDLIEGLAPCRASALAAARAWPRCEPALVQLSFAFQEDVEPAEQAQFAAAVDALNAPLVELHELLARLDLLLVAANELLASAQDELAPRLQEGLAEDPDGFGLSCAEERLPATTTWLEQEPALLSQLRDEALELIVPPPIVTE